MPQKRYVFDEELTGLVRDVVLKNKAAFQPRRRRRRSALADGGGGGADASVAGSFAVASDEIPEPEEITWADVPEEAKANVQGGDEIGDSEQCWKLGKGDVTTYQLVATTDGDTGDIADVYVVPVVEFTEGGDASLATGPIYNSAGQVSADTILQGKRFSLTVNGIEQKIFVVDVEKCG